MNDFLKEALSSEWVLKYLTEFIATAFLVALGNGAVANVELKGTKGNKSGWIVIAFGYGFGVMMPALMFGDVSGRAAFHFAVMIATIIKKRNSLSLY